MLYDESMAGKGANKIGNCLDKSMENIIFLNQRIMADVCAPQNKNLTTLKEPGTEIILERI